MGGWVGGLNVGVYRGRGERANVQRGHGWVGGWVGRTLGGFAGGGRRRRRRRVLLVFLFVLIDSDRPSRREGFGGWEGAGWVGGWVG